MLRSRTAIIPALLVAGMAAACISPQQRAESERRANARLDSLYVRSIYGPTWTLVRLGGAPAGDGAGGRPATAIFYSGVDRRVSGFAGCNQWTSTYEFAAPDSVKFAPPVSTKRACSEGMALENRFLAHIERTIRMKQRDSSLVMFASTGDSAVFVAR